MRTHIHSHRLTHGVYTRCHVVCTRVTTWRRSTTSVIRVKIRSLNAYIYVSNKFILNSSNLILKLEKWQVEVESTGKKVKRLKLRNIFGVFLYLESRDEQWKEENVRGDEKNRTSASKLFSDIGNPWLRVEKWSLRFINEKMLINRWEK